MSVVAHTTTFRRETTWGLAKRRTKIGILFSARHIFDGDSSQVLKWVAIPNSMPEGNTGNDERLLRWRLQNKKGQFTCSNVECVCACVSVCMCVEEGCWLEWYWFVTTEQRWFPSLQLTDRPIWVNCHSMTLYIVMTVADIERRTSHGGLSISHSAILNFRGQLRNLRSLKTRAFPRQIMTCNQHNHA